MNRLFNQISIVSRLFQKKLFINCILIVLLCMCVLFTNHALCEIRSINSNYDIITSINHKNTILYMVSADLKVSQNNSHLDISELEGLQSIGMMNYSSVKSGSEISNMYIYNKALIEHINIPLSKGEWNATVKKIGNTLYYPIIISKETWSLKYNSKTQLQLKSGDNLNVYVSGVLNKNQKFVNLSAATNAANADHLVKDCRNDAISFFAVQEFFPEKIRDGSFGGSSMFFFFDDISTNTDNLNYQVLRNQGYAYTLETLNENSLYQLRQGYTFYLPLLICLIMLSIIGSISFTVLSVKNNQEYYSCFLLCGGTKRDCLHLSILNSLWIVVLSLIITIAFTSILIAVKEFAGWHKISMINIISSAAIYLSFIAISVFMNNTLLKDKTVSQLLKKEV